MYICIYVYTDARVRIRIRMGDQVILMVTFYGLIDHIWEIHHELIALNYKTHQYPLLKHIREKKSDRLITQEMLNLIQSNGITHIFWFCLPNGTKLIQKIKEVEPTIVSFYYNFEDPLSLNINLIQCGSQMNYFFNPIEINTKKYSVLMGNNVITLSRYYHSDLLFNTINDYQPHFLVIYIDHFNDYDLSNQTEICQIVQEIIHSIGCPLQIYGHHSITRFFRDQYCGPLNDLNESEIYRQSRVFIYLNGIHNLLHLDQTVLYHAHLYGLPIITQKYKGNRILSHHQGIYDYSIDVINDLMKHDEKVLCDTCLSHSHDLLIEFHDWVQQLLNQIGTHHDPIETTFDYLQIRND